MGDKGVGKSKSVSRPGENQNGFLRGRETDIPKQTPFFPKIMSFCLRNLMFFLAGRFSQDRLSGGQMLKRCKTHKILYSLVEFQMPPSCLPDASQMSPRCASDASQMPPRLMSGTRWPNIHRWASEQRWGALVSPTWSRTTLWIFSI